MTAAKKKNSRRKQARFRSSRRKRIRNTVLLLLLLVVLGGTGIGAIYVLRNGTVFDKLEEAYVASREFSGGITDLDSLRTDGFAKNLCVVVSDVPMDGVSLGENQKGLLLDLDDKNNKSSGGYPHKESSGVTKMSECFAFSAASAIRLKFPSKSPAV